MLSRDPREVLDLEQSVDKSTEVENPVVEMRIQVYVELGSLSGKSCPLRHCLPVR